MQKTEHFSFLRKLSRKTIFITLFAALAIIAAVMVLARPTSSEAAETAQLQTAKVRTGDLVVTANGAGTIVPAAQVDLGFRMSGTLTELNVATGSAVTTGQVLARLEENIQAEADFQALFSAEGLAQAKLAVANAESALEDATNTLIYRVGSITWYWEDQLMQAEAALFALDANASDEQRTAAQAAVDKARSKQDYFLKSNIFTLAEDYDYFVTEADIALSRAEFESAKVALLDAQAALEIVQTGPEALTIPITALGAETARLEQVRLAVDNSRLVAPFDGSVVALNVVKEQTVGTSPVLTIATTNRLLVRFYLDETDIENAAAGMKVRFTLDAYPDLPVTGEVVLVEPTLQVVDGTPVIVVWASLPNETGFNLMSGMTVDAEVIAGESLKTLIVPVQALRELAPGSYAVFIVQADGQLVMTPVTVGLRDFANAEILSGVKAGDVVSTGTVETK
ncbi:MAG TPA: HlyD family efflux transporter periplasmic adaptor subunit [Anaerolineales bacterium]|nr:HlyD family efflux transporter periplasmic adaptor subunit [Anaerolineales bacterium]